LVYEKMTTGGGCFDDGVFQVAHVCFCQRERAARALYTSAAAGGGGGGGNPGGRCGGRDRAAVAAAVTGRPWRRPSVRGRAERPSVRGRAERPSVRGRARLKYPHGKIY
jgi:hypothetical protein